jgi:hypothetical protein
MHSLNVVKLFFKTFRFELIIILVVALLCHGLLLLNDGVYWDGWFLYSLLVKHDSQLLKELCSQLGLPLSFTYVWVLHYFSDVIFGAKLLGFLTLLLNSILIFFLAYKVKFISRLQSLAIATIYLVYPGDQTQALIGSLQYPASLGIFCIAALVATVPLQKNGKLALVWRMLSLILFLCAFNTNSLLVFYAGFFIYWYLIDSEYFTYFSFSHVIKFLIRRLDFIALPFIYWICRLKYFAPHGSFVNYNAVLINRSNIFSAGPWESILHDFRSYWLQAGLSHLSHLWDFHFIFLTRTIYILIPICFLLYQYSKKYNLNNEVKPSLNSTNRAPLKLNTLIWIFLFGLLLLGLGIFPYAMVDKVPIQGWNTRHALLSGLPMAIMITALLSVILLKRSGHKYFIILVSFVITIFAGEHFGNYVELQARWAQERSVLLQLKQHPEYKNYSTYIINKNSFVMIQGDQYAWYDWIGLLNSTFGGESRFAVFYDESHIDTTLESFQNDPLWMRLFSIKNYDRNGSMAEVSIENVNPEAHYKLARKYLFYKLTGQKEKLNQFLLDLLHVSIHDYLPAQSLKHLKSLESLNQKTVEEY